jgi:hypothetical protein
MDGGLGLSDISRTGILSTLRGENMTRGNTGAANGVAGPIKESRRLRIVIGHRRRSIQRHRDEIARLESDLDQLEDQLALVVKAETAVSA